MRKWSVTLSFGAGLLGGALSHNFSIRVAQAQSKTPLVKEERAESFVLVNEKGVVLGKFCDEGGRASLRLFDEHGREIWSTGGSIGVG